MTDRDQWDTGEPAARSHEQYSKKEVESQPEGPDPRSVSVKQRPEQLSEEAPETEAEIVAEEEAEIAEEEAEQAEASGEAVAGVVTSETPLYDSGVQSSYDNEGDNA